MLQPGDIVRFLNSIGGGRVVRTDGRMAYVEDEDGFEVPMPAAECVVVQRATDAADLAARQARAMADTVAVGPVAAPSKTPEQPHPATVAAPAPDVSETPEGDKLNIVLTYEPLDIKKLSTTTFDTFIINDSNYYLYVSYLTAPDDPLDDGRWTGRYAGIVEPNTQVWLGEVTRDKLATLERICVQFIAFKRDKPFGLKEPVSVTARQDVTKFCRLHCFRPNEYSETPVIAVPLVKDDVPSGQQPTPAELAEALGSSLNSREARAKARADRRKPSSVKRRPAPEHPELPQPGPDGIIEVDLHINALLDSTAGMSPADMLNYQVDHFRRVMDANLNRHGQRIVFIHGKGEGVLRQALMRELNYRYKGHRVQDASFHQYGFGATQVTVR